MSSGTSLDKTVLNACTGLLPEDTSSLSKIGSGIDEYETCDNSSFEGISYFNLRIAFSSNSQRATSL